MSIVAALRKLVRSERGALELSLAQLYLGALVLGLGLGRGVEADLQFLTEDLTGMSNYAASRLAAGHAKSANAIADNNVLSVAAMAPLLAVQADNITMDANAAIYCSNSATPGVAPVAAALCAEYMANKPRALAKLAWMKTQQMNLWSCLENLSGAMDKVAGAHGQEDIMSTLAGLDPKARTSFDDPTMQRDTWSSRNAFTGCSMAAKDALMSPMTGHAFPLLMPNMLIGLPQALVAGLPALCPSTGGGGGSPSMPGLPSLPKMKLPQFPEVSQKADQKCNDSQTHMRDQMSFAASKKRTPNDLREDEVTFSGDVDKHIKCEPLDPGQGAPKRIPGGPSSFIVKRGKAQYVCTFDRDECRDKALEEATEEFLKKMGMPSLPSFGMLGGSTRAPGALNANMSDDFRASASVFRAVDSKTAQFAENIQHVMSFGQIQGPSDLRGDVTRTAIGQWYFPAGLGPYAAVSPDQRAFMGAWRHFLGSNGL